MTFSPNDSTDSDESIAYFSQGGTYDITVKVTNNGEEKYGIVSIIVGSEPVANTASYTVDEDVTLPITLSGSDADIGDILEYWKLFCVIVTCLLVYSHHGIIHDDICIIESIVLRSNIVEKLTYFGYFLVFFLLGYTTI